MKTLNLLIQFTKLIFIAGLFSIFVVTFARPSIEKYLNAEVIVEKSSLKREKKDSPAITFCAYNEQNYGWKKKVRINGYRTWVDEFCNNTTSIKDAMTCLDEGTFNLSETVNWKKVGKLDIHSLAWTEDVTASYDGTLFYTLIYRVIGGN